MAIDERYTLRLAGKKLRQYRLHASAVATFEIHELDDPDGSRRVADQHAFRSESRCVLYAARFRRPFRHSRAFQPSPRNSGRRKQDCKRKTPQRASPLTFDVSVTGAMLLRLASELLSTP